MKLLQYTWKNSMMKIANSKMAVFVILMIVVSRSYVGAIRQFSVAVDYPSSWCVFLHAQVHALRKKADMLFMPDALNLVVRMYCSSSLR